MVPFLLSQIQAGLAGISRTSGQPAGEKGGDLGAAQTPQCLPGSLPPQLRAAAFLLRCILHTHVLAKKTRHPAAEETLSWLLLRAGPERS